MADFQKRMSSFQGPDAEAAGLQVAWCGTDSVLLQSQVSCFVGLATVGPDGCRVCPLCNVSLTSEEELSSIRLPHPTN